MTAEHSNMPSLKIKRGTKSQIEAAASSGLLNIGEPYLITDENRIAVGISTTNYESFAKKNEVGGGELPAGAFDYGLITVSADIESDYGSL